MKKLPILLVLMAGIMLVSSCSKDDDPVGPPSLNFIGGEGYVDEDSDIHVNTVFTVGIAASANAETGSKLTTLRLTRTMNNQTFLDTTLSINENSYNVDFQFNSQQAGQSETIAFILTDKEGQTASKSLVLTYISLGVNVIKTADVNMGSFNDDYGSFYATNNNQVYSIAEASNNQANIDFLFYKGVTNGSSIASPADADANTVYAISDWTTKNQTLFASTTLTAEDFDAIGEMYEFPEFLGTASGITNLESGDVIMFQTVGMKVGYIKVNSVNSRGDYMNLDVIVQE